MSVKWKFFIWSGTRSLSFGAKVCVLRQADRRFQITPLMSFLHQVGVRLTPFAPKLPVLC
jgi:hypothetical protein